MDPRTIKKTLYPDVEYVQYHLLGIEWGLLMVGVASLLVILLSGASPFYQQLQLRDPLAQGFAVDACHLVPGCIGARLQVWSPGGNRPWQLLVRLQRQADGAGPADLSSLQQQVRTLARTSPSLPVRQHADDLQLIVR